MPGSVEIAPEMRSRRFDEDVASFKPKYVSILLGMNDGEYKDFSAETFKTYTKGMS